MLKKPPSRGRERPGALLARRTRTVKQCSFDARSKGQPRPLPFKKNEKESEDPRLGQRAPRGKESVLADSGRVGEISAGVGWVRLIAILSILRSVRIIFLRRIPSSFRP